MLDLAARAFNIVFLTSMNVVFIARSRWIWMAVTGFLISWVWWWNTQAAAYTPGWASAAAYATGAMIGTLAGAWLAREIAR